MYEVRSIKSWLTSRSVSLIFMNSLWHSNLYEPIAMGATQKHETGSQKHEKSIQKQEYLKARKTYSNSVQVCDWTFYVCVLGCVSTDSFYKDAIFIRVQFCIALINSTLIGILHFSSIHLRKFVVMIKLRWLALIWKYIHILVFASVDTMTHSDALARNTCGLLNLCGL